MSAEPVEYAHPFRGHGGPWTERDFLALPEDWDQRVELIDGELVVSPHGDGRHQTIGHRLTREFEAALPDDIVALHEANVRLSDKSIPIPDVVVTRDLAGPLLYDVADVVLVAEVVSLSSTSKRRDRILKPSLYAEAGIPWYLRVEQDPHLELVLYRLAGDAYVEHARAVSGKRMEFSELGVTVEVDALLRRR